ncbi:hypothetical protein X747_28905 [Mesorhizobium sp. LNJC384A00]|uniref:DUF1036 domain-containing protein n=1 Tax=Mesorhizobium sp. LNJC384A00 TaxID=1287268 RepID=UPI0003CDE61A|nr:DUF1036 domain-containing protein [Mesorhizobium sp. LNJC384A00]ESY35274.1 hypothetical protein X747_28905 [Mesorhizobium sp. LNJC384A00]
MIFNRSILYIWLFTILASGHAFGASFDCNKATHADEMAICADQDLSARDEVVNDAYRHVKSLTKSSQVKKNINTTTHKFNNERGLCGGDVWCIKDVQERTLGYFRDLGANENFLAWGTATGSVDLDLPFQSEKVRINEETLSLRFCNKARQDVTMAMSFRTGLGSSQFAIKGWYALKVDECETFGPYPKGDFLWTAMASKPWALWGNGPRLCVSDAKFDTIYNPMQRCRNGYTLKFNHAFIVSDRFTIDMWER